METNYKAILINNKDPIDIKIAIKTPAYASQQLQTHSRQNRIFCGYLHTNRILEYSAAPTARLFAYR